MTITWSKLTYESSLLLLSGNDVLRCLYSVPDMNSVSEDCCTCEIAVCELVPVVEKEFKSWYLRVYFRGHFNRVQYFSFCVYFLRLLYKIDTMLGDSWVKKKNSVPTLVNAYRYAFLCSLGRSRNVEIRCIRSHKILISPFTYLNELDCKFNIFCDVFFFFLLARFPVYQ